MTPRAPWSICRAGSGRVGHRACSQSTGIVEDRTRELGSLARHSGRVETGLSERGRGLLIRNTIRGPVLQPQPNQLKLIVYRSVSLSLKRRQRGRPAEPLRENGGAFLALQIPSAGVAEHSRRFRKTMKPAGCCTVFGTAFVKCSSVTCPECLNSPGTFAGVVDVPGQFSPSCSPAGGGCSVQLPLTFRYPRRQLPNQTSRLSELGGSQLARESHPVS